jgi:glycosyltransferase involved in cell wall biosynthesis
MTGGCHYALGCSGYKTNCEKCPQVHSIFHKSVSNSLLQSKSIAANGNIRLVTPSSWIREEAEKSHALRNLPIRNIFNPIPTSYAAVNRKEARLKLEISETVCLLGFSAAILQSPFKGINDFIGALKILAEVSPIPFEILFIGNGLIDTRDIPFKFKQVSATSDDEIAQFLGALDLLVVPSIADNSPSIIGESQMAGTAVVGSSIGGIPELIDDERRLFKPNNSQDLARVILENIKASNEKSIRNVAKARFSYEKIASKFSDYYLESLK